MAEVKHIWDEDANLSSKQENNGEGPLFTQDIRLRMGRRIFTYGAIRRRRAFRALEIADFVGIARTGNNDAAQGAGLGQKAFMFMVYDPTYFVDIDLVKPIA
jgi:hypothetical protein